MSVRQLAVLGASRDQGTPNKPKRTAVKTDGSTAPAAAGESSTSALDALVTAIPTEPLALYTGLVAGILALFPADSNASGSYVPLRWGIFGVSAAVVCAWVVAGYLTSPGRGRKFPLPEAFTATAAFAAWALATPGSPLRAGLTGDTDSVVTLCITFGGATLVYLMAQFGLTRPSNKGKAEATAPAPATTADPPADTDREGQEEHQAARQAEPEACLGSAGVVGRGAGPARGVGRVVADGGPAGRRSWGLAAR